MKSLKFKKLILVSMLCSLATSFSAFAMEDSNSKEKNIINNLENLDTKNNNETQINTEKAEENKIIDNTEKEDINTKSKEGKNNEIKLIIDLGDKEKNKIIENKKEDEEEKDIKKQLKSKFDELTLNVTTKEDFNKKSSIAVKFEKFAEKLKCKMRDKSLSRDYDRIIYDIVLDLLKNSKKLFEDETEYIKYIENKKEINEIIEDEEETINTKEKDESSDYIKKLEDIATKYKEKDKKNTEPVNKYSATIDINQVKENFKQTIEYLKTDFDIYNAMELDARFDNGADYFKGAMETYENLFKNWKKLKEWGKLSEEEEEQYRTVLHNHFKAFVGDTFTRFNEIWNLCDRTKGYFLLNQWHSNCNVNDKRIKTKLTEELNYNIYKLKQWWDSEIEDKSYIDEILKPHTGEYHIKRNHLPKIISASMALDSAINQTEIESAEKHKQKRIIRLSKEELQEHMNDLENYQQLLKYAIEAYEEADETLKKYEKSVSNKDENALGQLQLLQNELEEALDRKKYLQDDIEYKKFQIIPQIASDLEEEQKKLLKLEEDAEESIKNLKEPCEKLLDLCSKFRQFAGGYNEETDNAETTDGLKKRLEYIGHAFRLKELIPLSETEKEYLYKVYEQELVLYEVVTKFKLWVESYNKKKITQHIKRIKNIISRYDEKNPKLAELIHIMKDYIRKS